jgi:hypothetical protein
MTAAARGKLTPLARASRPSGDTRGLNRVADGAGADAERRGDPSQRQPGRVQPRGVVDVDPINDLMAFLEARPA